MNLADFALRHEIANKHRAWLSTRQFQWYLWSSFLFAYACHSGPKPTYPFRSLEKTGVVKLDRGPKRPSSARRHPRHCPAVGGVGPWLPFALGTKICIRQAPPARSIEEGLVGGKGIAVDASLFFAEVQKQNSSNLADGEDRMVKTEDVPRAAREYLAVLDDAAFSSAREVTGGRFWRATWKYSTGSKSRATGP